MPHQAGPYVRQLRTEVPVFVISAACREALAARTRMYTTVDTGLMFRCQREGLQYVESSPEAPLFRCASAIRLVMESHDNATDHQCLFNDLLEICVRHDYDPYSDLAVFGLYQAQEEHSWLGYAFHQCRQAARLAAEKSPARAHLSRFVNTSIDGWMREDLAARTARDRAAALSAIASHPPARVPSVPASGVDLTGSPSKPATPGSPRDRAAAVSAIASHPPARVPYVPPSGVGLTESPSKPASPGSPRSVPVQVAVSLPPPSPSRPATPVPLAAPVGPLADCPATPVARPAPHDEAPAAPAQDALARFVTAEPVSPPSMMVPCIEHVDDDSSS